MAVINGIMIEPQVGSCIRPEDWPIGNRLAPSDWSQADYRLPVNSGGSIYSLAVNVRVSGRTLRKIHGSYYVRVVIEFVGDGEPSTYTGGWMLVE